MSILLDAIDLDARPTKPPGGWPRLVRARNFALRVWVVVLIGLVMTCMAEVRALRPHGIYWGQVNVTFLAPISDPFPNNILSQSGSLVMAAGIVQKMVGSSVPTEQVASDTVTLYDEGFKHGYTVSLPNTGGQWANDYSQALLDVQTVGTSVYEVDSTMNQVVGKIQTALATMQARANVAAIDFIRAQPSPSTPQVYYIAGSGIRAGAATLALGIGLTAALALAVRRASWRRKQTFDESFGLEFLDLQPVA